MLDISKMNMTELKALAFDQLSEQSRITRNLQLIEQEIQKRESEPKQEENGK